MRQVCMSFDEIRKIFPDPKTSKNKLVNNLSTMTHQKEIGHWQQPKFAVLNTIFIMNQIPNFLNRNSLWLNHFKTTHVSDMYCKHNYDKHLILFFEISRALSLQCFSKNYIFTHSGCLCFGFRNFVSCPN